MTATRHRDHRYALGLVLAPFALASGCVTESSTTTSKQPLGGALHEDHYLDSSGVFANVSTAGRIDTSNAFFQSFGTNGRTCATCHRPETGFALGTDSVQLAFWLTAGLDPLFRTVDGANAPTADVSTFAARLDAYSLLLARGTIRIEQGLPANAEFTVDSISDPYGYATADKLSLYRKPRPSSNTAFVVGTAIMWDGREATLASQANDATLQHAEASQPLTAAQQQEIVDFETSVYTAQTNVFGLGTVDGLAGPVTLAQQPFALNTNAPLPPPADPLTRTVFTLFDDWATSPDPNKQAVARGQDLFNHRVFGKTKNGLPMTCSFCHSSINVGGIDHAGGGFVATGTSGEGPLTFPNSGQFLSPDLPVYTLKNKTTGALLHSNDPGRAMQTGLWNDVGRFQVPNLRGVAARAPYFHNGMAATLDDVINFYNVGKATPSGLPFTDQEKSDLVAFLQAL
jgi:cytochrome c peroxidase